MRAIAVLLAASLCLSAFGQIELHKGARRGSGGSKAPVSYSPGTVRAEELKPRPRPAPQVDQAGAKAEQELSAKSIIQATRDIAKPQQAKHWWWQQALFGIGATLALIVVFRVIVDKFVPKPD